MLKYFHSISHLNRKGENSMSDKPPLEIMGGSKMQRFREWVAAIISLMIITGSFVMIGVSFSYISSPGDEFARVKDLLLFINPLLGVVIGYYFNKVTSDTRAETAETAAKTAVISAEQAVEARDVAQAVAETAQADATQVKSSLQELSEWAGQMVEQVPTAAAPGTLSGTAAPSEDLIRLQMQGQLALERARKVLNK
jgi:hypothetical protein